MKIAVLGASGMLGCHVAHQAAARGHELVVVHRPSSQLKHLRGLEYEARVASMGEPGPLVKALRGVDALIHAAGYYPTVPRPWHEDRDMAAEQTQQLLDACRSAGVPRLVYVGAAIALRRNPSGEPGHEGLTYSEPPADLNGYLQAKWVMERMVLDAASAPMACIVGIPTMTFGEYDDGATTGRLVLGIANGTLPRYARGLRNVVYAPDAGRGLVLCAERGRSGERYLITGHNTSMDALTALIAGLSGRPPPKAIAVGVARTIARLAAMKYRWLGGAVPQLTEAAVAVMASGQLMQTDKAQRELGYTPTATLEQTVERSLAWFSSQGMWNPANNPRRS